MNNRKAISIVVATQKGGVGKTTTVLALASAFSRLNKRVLVVDLDFQGNATQNLGLEMIALEQRRTVTEAIQRGLTAADIVLSTHDQNVSLIAADISLNTEVRRYNGTSRQFSLVRKIMACPETDDSRSSCATRIRRSAIRCSMGRWLGRTTT